MQEGLQLTRLSIQCTIDERRSLVFDLGLVLCRGRQDSSQQVSVSKHVFDPVVFALKSGWPPLIKIILIND